VHNATYPYTYNPNYNKIQNINSTHGVFFGEIGLGGFPFVAAEASLFREAVGGRRDVLLEFVAP
jgi:hypothetical protein